MKKKKLLNLFAIIIGALMCFGFSKVQATDSIFNGKVITRYNLQYITASNALTTSGNSVDLRLSKIRQSGDYYSWENNTTEEAKYVWKIRKSSSSQTSYDDQYYCLNAERGFGITDERMAEGQIDTYSNEYEMNLANKDNIINAAGGDLGTNYNQILWILDNSYIPTQNSSKLSQFKSSMSSKGVNISDLNQEQIEVVQQMAIWYFTNNNYVEGNSTQSNKGKLPAIYKNGTQLSSISDDIADQMDNLYRYFIGTNHSGYTRNIPTLTLSNSNTTVRESGNYFIVGPFSLSGSNTELISEITATVTPNSYVLLNSNNSSDIVSNNDFLQVIGNNFYLRFLKNDITQTTRININLNYKYNTRTLTFITDETDIRNTQPVVLVEDGTDSDDTSTNYNIYIQEIGNLKIVKTSEGNVTPGNTEFEITGPNNYRRTVKYSDFSGNSYTINNLPLGEYTVTEKTNTAQITNYTLVVTGDNGTSKNVSKNATVTFTINNTYTQDMGNLEIVKTSVGNVTPENTEFEITGPNNYIRTVRYSEFSNNTYTINNIPLGEYTVTEKTDTAQITNYVLVVTGDNGTSKNVSKNATVTFTINNIYAEETGNLEIVKTSEGNTTPGNTEFEITGPNNYSRTVRYSEFSNNTYTINNIPLGEYTVTEKTDTAQITNYTLVVTGDNGTSKNVSKDATVTFTINNTYTAGTPDLALRKFITKIGNKSYDREPVIGGWTLDNGTTASKTHSKNALTVEKDDIVTYTIRIYNEGNIAGKATLVTDYLPNGLELLNNNTINNENGWEVKETTNGYTAVTTNHLKDTTINPYSGRGIPEFVDLQIVCKVTAEAGDTAKNLKNIAEITTATFENGTDIDSVPGNVNASNSYNPTNPTDGRGEQDDDDFELLVLEAREPEFDVALRKFITKINDISVNREPVVDHSTIATTGTATYKHKKDPISVQVGDIVTYKIRVYNEGETDGYVAKITDHLPKWLDFIVDDETNIKYLWNIDDDRTISTEITKKESTTGEQLYSSRTNKQLLKAYDGVSTPDFIDVEIRCRVNDKAPVNRLLTNIAEISKMQDATGTEIITDRDSTKANVDLPTDVYLPEYKGNANNKTDLTDSNYYYAGQEDDDDFEKIIVDSFDLSLRKFITKIGNTEYNRQPVVDTTNLGINGVTTATYTHSKNPLEVKKGDIITYTLRVYNEGTLPGYATEIIDYIPEGLAFIEDSLVNKEYGWEIKDGKLITTYLANKLIDKQSYTGADLDYKDVQIQLKVTADPKEYAGSIITNWAEIKEDSNNDIDSTPGNGLNYKEEDDIDYEPVKLVYFDLALRKFITNVNGTEYNNRIPQVDTSKLGTIDEKGKKITSFIYTHTKDPVVVETESTVIYTIRVYNEGNISGYALEITDDIPEGLEFLPQNETNIEYRWKMLDSEGNITDDVSKTKKITTTYLAEELLNAYQKESGSELISYKDVKVAFKVIEPNKSDRIIINTAEISKASNEDIDSITGNNDLTEDDIDREYLKVKYFDLTLKKWVTETRVTYNGKTKVTKSGFNENSIEMAKVDLVASKLKKTTVKFVYKIKVINEGEIAGYATKIEDYIPKGFKFVEADNPKWNLEKNNVAVTDQLKDQILEPGQSATVEIVLTWKNSSSNMGVKTNWAEIKEDSGDDIDSTPDNYNKLEDDIDSANVILSIKTGNSRTYIILALISVAIICGGTIAIKKYVIK